MIIPIKIRTTRKGIGLTVREWKPIIKEAWEAGARFWYERFLPKHFTRSGAAQYYYAPRTKNYMITKARKHGHQDPLVFTGRLKREVTSFFDVRSTARGAKVVLHGPRYLYQYRKRLNDPDKAAELTRIIASEARAIEGAIDKFIQRRVDVLDRKGGFKEVRMGRIAL